MLCELNILPIPHIHIIHIFRQRMFIVLPVNSAE
jgi:hypothetical protein